MNFLPTLTLLLIGMKLAGFMNDWSWWWVWSPMLVPLAGMALCGLVHVLSVWFETSGERQDRELRNSLAAMTRRISAAYNAIEQTWHAIPVRSQAIFTKLSPN